MLSSDSVDATRRTPDDFVFSPTANAAAAAGFDCRLGAFSQPMNVRKARRKKIANILGKRKARSISYHQSNWRIADGKLRHREKLEKINRHKA
jgi:hypothetical protein